MKRICAFLILAVLLSASPLLAQSPGARQMQEIYSSTGQVKVDGKLAANPFVSTTANPAQSGFIRGANNDVKGQHYLVASLDDYVIARKLALGLLKSALSGTTPKCRALVAWAKTVDVAFSKQDVDRAMNWSRKTTLKYIREAVDLGSVGMNKETVSKSSEFRFLKDPEDPLVELPQPDEINPDWTPGFQEWT